MTRTRIVVGMSGGVDSSVAALLLHREGHDVLGLFMKNWEDDDSSEYCSSRTDLVDAVSVAECIGIEIDQVNFAAEYKNRVFAEFLREYRAGRTPNPDVLCNAEIKFRAFLDHALARGADGIATGHYARLRHRDGRTELLKGLDPGKDQSYFLYRLDQRQLAHARFPLGELPKSEVRAIARAAGLAVHSKKDSTGICFIGERPFRAFLNRYLPREPGDICTAEGSVVGRHAGLMYYTIGQRQGLGIGGRPDGDGSPWFVAGKDLPRNRLIVVQGHDHPALLRSDLVAGQLSWTGGDAPAAGTRLAAKTRYRQQDAACTIAAIDSLSMRVSFDAPQWAVTPGQSVVLYDGEICLGGGIIE